MNKGSLISAVIVSMMLVVAFAPLVTDDGGSHTYGAPLGNPGPGTDYEAEGYIPISTPADLAKVGQEIPAASDHDGKIYTWGLDEKYYLTNDIDFAGTDTNGGIDMTVSVTVGSGRPDGASVEVTVTPPSEMEMTALYVWAETVYGDHTGNSNSSGKVKADNIPRGDSTVVIAGTAKVTATSSSVYFVYSMSVDTTENGVLPAETFSNNGNFTPIGYTGALFNKTFTGTFDGNGKTITGMRTATFSPNVSGNAGLFVSLRDAHILDLNITDSSAVTASESNSYAYAGGIVAGAGGSTVIENCYCNGSVTAAVQQSGNGYSYAYAGGIAGISVSANITECRNSGRVTAVSSGYAYAGGIAGSGGGEISEYGSITRCYNDSRTAATTSGSSMSGSAQAGGILGTVGGPIMIDDCVNKGPISALSGRSFFALAGGIVGQTTSSAAISGCVNDASVLSEIITGAGSAGSGSGGIVGRIASSGVNIYECSNTDEGMVTALASENPCAGGIVGIIGNIQADYNYIIATVSICLNAGIVKAETYSGSGSTEAGGIVGFALTYSSITISECYNVGHIIGTLDSGPDVGGIVGRALTFMSGQIMISDSYNVGIVEESCPQSLGAPRVGGILGYAQAEPEGSVIRLVNCYNAGRIETTSNYSDVVGGIVGGYRTYVQNGPVTGSVEIVNCYFLEDQMWDNRYGKLHDDLIYGDDNTAGMPSPTVDGVSVPERTRDPDQSSGAKSMTEMRPDLTDAQKGDSIYYTGTTAVKGDDAGGWDFTDVWIINSETNDGYPILRSSLENAQMPVITDQYVSGWVLKNSSAELYVTAAVTDGGMLTYQWYGSGDGTDFGPISGAVSETYDAPTGTIGWRYYYVIVTNTIDDNYDGGIKTKEVKSDVIALKVNDAAAVDADVPDITSQPVGGSVNQNAVKVLTVEASVTDGGTLTYQWYSIDTPVAGATGTSYTVPTWAGATQITYYVTVTNTIADNDDGGIKTRTVVSDTVWVYVSTTSVTNAQPPVIDVPPDGGSVLRDDVYTLHVTATVTDGGTLTYQWYSNTVSGSNGATPITGATGTSYTVPTDVTGTLYYYVVVTNTNTGADGNNTAASTSKIVMIKVTDTPDNDDSGGLPLALIAGAAIAAIIAIAAVVYYLFIRRP